MAQEQTQTGITQVGTVAVPVADHERALDFYVGTLGFEKRRDGQFGEGQRWVEVAPVGATTTIALAPPGEVRPPVDTGIRLFTTDCEADHRRLGEQGARVGELLRWPGIPPMFTLQDPDGNTLYVVATGDR